MKKTEHFCDIKDCGRGAVCIQGNIQVLFTTDQTEGRAVPPYLSDEKIDLCADHMTKLLSEGKYIHARGAMGYNEYYL